MLKLLRQYNKYILVVGGVLLMIVFLIPSALQKFGRDPAHATVLRVNGHRITQDRMTAAGREYQALERLTMQLLPAFGIGEGVEQWLLLSDLAERGGFVGGPLEGRTYMNDIAHELVRLKFRSQYGDFADQILNSPQFAPQVDQDLKQTLAIMNASFPTIGSQNGFTDEQIEQTLAKLRGVNRLENAYALSARVSTQRALLKAKKQLDRATIDYIFLAPDRVLADVPEPDEGALKAQLDRFKDLRPGEGEFGIGYLLPARIKLEYLTVARQGIEAKVQPDPKDVRKRFASSPQPKDVKFEDMRAQIEVELKNETVEKILREIDQTIRREVAKRTLKFKSDGQFKVLPADWATNRPTLEFLRDAIVVSVKEKTGVTIDAPAVAVMNASFQTHEDLLALPAIGRAFLERGSRREPFPSYALAVHEIEPNTPVPLQVGLPSPEPVKDAGGNLYYFTVLDTRKESAPISVDDAREMLVRDWKRLQAYELLKRDADGFKQKAIAEGLDALDTARPPAPDPGKPAPNSPLVTRGATVTRSNVSPRAPEVDTQEFRDQIIEAAARLDPQVDAATIDIAQRILVVQAPKKQGLVAAQLKVYSPLTVEQFRSQEAKIANQMQIEEMRAGDNPFTLARLRERLKVTDPEGKKLVDKKKQQ